MLFSNRGLKPNSMLDESTNFDYGAQSEYTPLERDAINESFDDDYTPLTGAPDNNPFSTDGIIDEAAMMEALIVQEAEKMNDAQRAEYLNSAEFNSLVEAGVVGKRALVRLSREADMDRRIHLLCLQMAQEKGDADWEALRRNRIKEKQLLNKLYNKYGNRVKRQAATSQKRLVKLSPRMFNLNEPIR